MAKREKVTGQREKRLQLEGIFFLITWQANLARFVDLEGIFDDIAARSFAVLCIADVIQCYKALDAFIDCLPTHPTGSSNRLL